MRLRRVIADGSSQLQAWNGHHWAVVSDEDLAGSAARSQAFFKLVALDLPQRARLVQAFASRPIARDGSPLLPFEPKSFRDFMLYEEHAIGAARGYARRFLPAAYQLARAFEAVTRRTLPQFRPHALWYGQPLYYMGNHLTFVTDEAEIAWPDYTRALDYELELGFVLARPLLNATREEASAAIGAFVVLNDFSARDVQLAEMRSGFGPQKSKHFATAMSDVAVTADEVLPHIDSLSASIAINGKTVARCSSAGARYTLGEALAHVSRYEQLYAGEVFGTGTWPGGSALENGHWLAGGDRITLEIERVGTLTSTIVAPRSTRERSV